MRKIIHIDMDAFFASVEQRDKPELRGQPVVVGGMPGRRGVVAAASYEARKFGVRSAMPSGQAQKLCPQAVFLPPRFAEYREVSQQIHAIFRRYTEIIEPLSIDEAFLDVSGQEQYNGSATRMAQAIKDEIRVQTGLTASAGVSYNKFLAKIASDMDKPDGLFVITPEQGPDFVARLPIGDFYGVGKATEAKMKRLGIDCGADLRRHSREWLALHFGKSGDYYYNISRGIDERPVRTQRTRKSVGSETTFEQDLYEREAMLDVLRQRLDKVVAGIKAKSFLARTLTIKVKYADFTQVTRSHSFIDAHQDVEDFAHWLPALLDSTEVHIRPVRLLGVTLSGFEHAGGEESATQLDLF